MLSVNRTGAVDQDRAADAVERLGAFRSELFGCLGRRADELFELTDALLCADGPVHSLVGLCLVAEHHRGHGAVYDALNHGTVDAERLCTRLAGLPLPRMFGGRIVSAVDASAWLRPDAETCPDRLFCHVYGRGRSADQRIPGWPYQLVVALESGPTSWTAALDVVRLGPADDATAVTATQLRAVVGRLIAAGHWQPGDPPIMVVLDSGYDVCRLAFVLADLPLQLVGRIRSDRVMLAALGSQPAAGKGQRPVGRPRRHGAAMALADPDSWPAADAQMSTDTSRYGKAESTAWVRMHPRLTHRGSWTGHDEGTLIRLRVQHLPGQREATPVWLWSSHAGDDIDDLAAEVIGCWQAYLRRFDEEHTFRLLKQTLGWTRPKIRSPQAADRWTWLVLAAHTQLRLARHLTADLRRPWEKPLSAERLTPARVRRGFRYLRVKITQPASAPKTSHPGPGRPPGLRNRQCATRHDVGKTHEPDSDRTCPDRTRG
jgi:hypothetical protein